MPHVETEAKEIIICTCAEKYIVLSTHVKEVCSCIFYTYSKVLALQRPGTTNMEALYWVEYAAMPTSIQ